MNNPNPFLPQSSFLEQKNKARARLRIVVLFSISLGVMVLMALLIQGCRKNDTGQTPDQTGAPTPEAASNPTPDTNNGGPGGGAVAGNPGTVPAPPPVEPSNPVPPPPPVAPEPTTSDYVVVKGDTFATIHTKFPGVSVKAIEQANPGVDPKRLKIGQKLHIPAATSAAPMGSPTPGAGTESATPGGEQTYKVKSGDTLDAIHKKFHVSIKAIQSANNLKTTSIRVGQTLKIPSKAAPEAAPAETTPPAPTSTPTMPPPALAPATPTNH
jgi:LysM repeat protein